MDQLTFISNLVDSLAWPVVALALGLVFRRKLIDLILSLRKLKAGPVEAEFELAAKQALANAEEVKPQEEVEVTATTTENSSSGDRQVIARLREARSDPAGAILEGWAKVDGELFRLGVQMGTVFDPLENTGMAYSAVLASGILPVQTIILVRELHELRNKVAHVKVHPTPEAAQDYLLAVDRACELIFNFRKNLPNYGPSNRQ